MTWEEQTKVHEIAGVMSDTRAYIAPTRGYRNPAPTLKEVLSEGGAAAMTRQRTWL